MECLLDSITLLYVWSVTTGCVNLSNCNHKIKAMERDMLQLSGKERAEAKENYMKVLRSCEKECMFDEPKYYLRS